MGNGQVGMGGLLEAELYLKGVEGRGTYGVGGEERLNFMRVEGPGVFQ